MENISSASFLNFDFADFSLQGSPILFENS